MNSEDFLEELKSLHNLANPSNTTKQLGDTKNWQSIAFAFEKQIWNLHQMLEVLIDKIEVNKV